MESYNFSEERCVCCGKLIPEGFQYCIQCWEDSVQEQYLIEYKRKQDEKKNRKKKTMIGNIIDHFKGMGTKIMEYNNKNCEGKDCEGKESYYVKGFKDGIKTFAMQVSDKFATCKSVEECRDVARNIMKTILDSDVDFENVNK